MTILFFASVALGAAVIFWDKICNWVAEVVVPWLEQHVPALAPYLEKAFVTIDRNIMAPLRGVVIRAWRMIRPYLLQAIVAFEKTGNTWIRRLTSYLKSKLPDQVVRRIEEQEVDWVEIPEEVRLRILEGRANRKVDFTELRDREVQELELAT